MSEWTAEHPKLGRLTFTGHRKAEVVAEVRKQYGVSVSKTVRRVVVYRRCVLCECAPCVCGAKRWQW